MAVVRLYPPRRCADVALSRNLLKTVRLLVAALLLPSLASCKDKTCVPGAQSSCPCLGGGEAVQVCLANGTYAPCQCSALADMAMPMSPFTPTAPGEMAYYGGHVITNGTVVEVDWNGGYVDTTALYKWMPSSSYLGWLAMVYATDIVSTSGAPGTNEQPSLAAYGGEFSVSYDPVPSGDIPAGAVEDMLNHAIAQMLIPPPAPNTLYAVHLPAGHYGFVSGLGGGTACGFHNNLHYNNGAIHAPYTVVGGVDECAADGTASHEVAEAMINPDPYYNGGSWVGVAPASGEEIADICAPRTAELFLSGGVDGGLPGLRFELAYLYNNVSGNCTTY